MKISSSSTWRRFNNTPKDRFSSTPPVSCARHVIRSAWRSMREPHRYSDIEPPRVALTCQHCIHVPRGFRGRRLSIPTRLVEQLIRNQQVVRSIRIAGSTSSRKRAIRIRAGGCSALAGSIRGARRIQDASSEGWGGRRAQHPVRLKWAAGSPRKRDLGLVCCLSRSMPQCATSRPSSSPNDLCPAIHSSGCSSEHSAVKIFVSYPHQPAEHADVAERVAARLRTEEGIDEVWMDRDHLLSGNDWPQEIVDGILTSDCTIGFLSRYAVREPGVCLNELSLSSWSRGGDGLIPIELEKLDELPLSVSHVQTRFLRTTPHQKAASRDRSSRSVTRPYCRSSEPTQTVGAAQNWTRSKRFLAQVATISITG